MQTVFEKSVSAGSACVGTIGIGTRRLFVGSPLTQYSFDDEQERVLNGNATSAVECVALAHDERTLAYSTSTVVKLVDLNTGRELRTLVGHNGSVNAVVQSNRSIYVWASVSSDCTMSLWDTRQHPANVQLRRLDRAANCAKFSPDDAFVALGSDHLYMMDPRMRDMRSLSSTSQILHVCFHPSEYLLAAASEDRLVRFWDIDSEECVSQSEPTDGLPRAIAFHNDGAALFTLTDRRCGAICWEPFDVLGQCNVPQSDHSLAMAVDDSQVYVLSRALTQNTLSLQTVNIMDLLNEPSEVKEAPPPPASKEEESVVSEESWEQKDMRVDCEPTEQDAFVPRRTLPRTPPPEPFTLPPSEETFVVSMVTPTPAQPRPNTLKTRRTETNLKNVGKTTSTSVSRVRRTLANSKSGGGGMMACTSSAPDIRATPVRRRSEREEKPKKRQQQQHQHHEAPNEEISTGIERCTDEALLMKEMSNGHADIMSSMTQRRLSMDQIRQIWRSRGVDSALSEATRIGDSALRAEVVSALNHSPATWNLTLCCALLPHIQTLVASEHEYYVEIALSALRTAVTGFGNVIRMGAQQSSHIGVDVTAEERHSKCINDPLWSGTKVRTRFAVTCLVWQSFFYHRWALTTQQQRLRTECVQQLTEMRVKTSLLCDQMNARHAREFNALMQIFDDTISPV